MFLTPDELEDLTGRKRASAQVRWLKDHKYPFAPNADGVPRVLRSVVLSRLGGYVDNEPRLRLT